MNEKNVTPDDQIVNTEPAALADTRRYPTREGKKAVTIYIDQAEYRSLRVLAALDDKTVQDVVLMAVSAFIAQNPFKAQKLAPGSDQKAGEENG